MFNRLGPIAQMRLSCSQGHKSSNKRKKRYFKTEFVDFLSTLYLCSLDTKVQYLSDWGTPPPHWWFDSHLVTKCLDGIPIFLANGTNFFVHL